MEQIQSFNWAQFNIDKLTGSISRERHEAQRDMMQDNSDKITNLEQRQLVTNPSGENRAQRRDRERLERRTNKKAKVMT